MGRFDPFYTPVQCTSPLLLLPIHKYLVMDTTVAPAVPKELDVNNFPVNMLCTNPNQLDMTIGTKSTGDVMLLNADGSMATVGPVTTPIQTTFKINSKKVPFVVHMGMKLPMTVVSGLQAALAAQTAAKVLVPAVPLFFSLHADTKIESNFMFMANSDTMVIPKKYCGAMATMLAPGDDATAGIPIPAGALRSVTATICRNSMAEAITAVTSTILPRELGKYHSPMFIDSMDPLKTYLDEQEAKAKGGAMMFFVMFNLHSIGFLGAAIFCLKKFKAAKAAQAAQ